MNELAKSHLLNRIRGASTLDDLRRIWEGLNPSYQRDTHVLREKDRRKQELGGG